MRTNNGKVKNVIISVYFILVVLAIIVITLMSSFQMVDESPLTTIFIVLTIFVVLFLITHKVSKYFEYDSDGLKVIVRNKGLLISEFVNYREYKIEFDKEDLLAYRLNNYLFYKSLVLTLKDSRGKIKKEVFNVTLVSRKKLKYIRQSLSKMIKMNKKKRSVNT